MGPLKPRGFILPWKRGTAERKRGRGSISVIDFFLGESKMAKKHRIRALTKIAGAAGPGFDPEI
jgi:hypothetical protein